MTAGELLRAVIRRRGLEPCWTPEDGWTDGPAARDLWTADVLDRHAEDVYCRHCGETISMVDSAWRHSDPGLLFTLSRPAGVKIHTAEPIRILNPEESA